ncbi:hypothetical protein caldi_34130 [Caldinitratiruptor microaerophilus]|uniref:Uncharacterized protein n=2 Tax=Caldinitratiruptor microaerophilus TaxID=671077 RepID=A0AA35CPC0_9FIRM|nr:hypothetical protein caldi_34130 [Caldinitratiruptor microaerophilus]
MLMEVARICHGCGYVVRLELVPDARYAETRAKALRARAKERRGQCPRCRSRDGEIVARPVPKGGGAA